MALIKHCIRVISWNNSILKSLAVCERIVIKVLAVFPWLLMSAEASVSWLLLGLSCVAAPCAFLPISVAFSRGKVILHWNSRTKSCNKINTGSRVSDVTPELEWEWFLKPNSSVIEFQTKQSCHDEKEEKFISERLWMNRQRNSIYQGKV